MRGRIVRMSLAWLAVLTLFAIPSLAQGRGRARARTQTRATVVIDNRVFDRGDFARGRVIIRDRGTFRGDFRNSGRPPGWDRGRKVGWGNCDLPPGLAKKRGCNGFTFRDTRFPRRGTVIIDPRVPRRGPVVVIPIR